MINSLCPTKKYKFKTHRGDVLIGTRCDQDSDLLKVWYPKSSVEMRIHYKSVDVVSEVTDEL